IVRSLDAVLTSGDTFTTRSRAPSAWLRRVGTSRVSLAVGAVLLLAAAAYGFVSLRHPGIHSIAVLPFRVTPAADTGALAYVASGLTDGVRRELMRIPGLAVAAGASSEVMKDSANLGRVADALHVASV